MDVRHNNYLYCLHYLCLSSKLFMQIIQKEEENQLVVHSLQKY